ncbi:MAG TPA: ceramide glucosyltransferase, partial [Stellaceae bacterium]|nr:ceramide glucosyltransferase [Stellaceae bacterium]
MIFALWAAGFCAVAAGLHLATVAIASCRCRRRVPGPATSGPTPAVTVLRPVCGAEPFAGETLGSGFRLLYADYEMIFCFARKDDPVVPIVRRLIDDNPQVPARLLIGDERFCANPKLDNLRKGWQAALHEWIVIADSNVLMPRDCLQRLLGRWQDDTGAVCSMPLGTRPENFWAELECAFLNTFQARVQYVSEALGCGFAQGKTMLLRRDLVERGGGFRGLAAETAEDAAVTKMVRALGRRVHLVDRPFDQPLGRRSAAAVWARQLRWARLRRMSFPVLFLPEVFAGSALPSLALALAASHYGVNVPAAVASFLILWFGAEAALARLAGWRMSARMAAALLLRDLLLPVLWVAA